MTLGFRQGGFSSPGFGPFRTGGGDFSRYNIGDDGAQLDAAKRDAAVIAWGNGTLTDDAYLAALKAYWQKQGKDDPRWLSARDDYEDAVYSIGRNQRVRAVNNSASSRERLAALDALIGYDQRRLRTMTARGRNEQARELEDRIADAEGQMRETRYGDSVRRYNNDRATTAQMLAAARRMARDSQGSPDHETWVDRVTEWENRQWDEEYATAQDAYRRTLTASNGNIRAAGDTLIQMLEQRLGRMGQGTPGRRSIERQLRDTREQVVEDVWNRRVADASMARNEGQLNDSGYIAVLHDRVRALPQGSQAKKEAQAQLINDTYILGEKRIRERIQLPDGDEDHLDPFEAIPFYQGYLATMQPGTERYREITAEITRLKLMGIQDVSLAGDPTDIRDSRGGHWILPTGNPDGTAGFTSQFDGSAFATQNCMFASAAMMFDALGGADLSGADLRRYAGDPEGAGFQSDIQRAYESLGFATDRYNGMGFRQFMKRLDASQGGAVVIGLLASLPQQYRLTSGGGAHGVYVTSRHRNANGQRFTWVMDPLGRAGYDGAWWPDEVLQQFAWSGARNPISGNAIYGNVIFGKRTGRSNVTSQPRQPRFQAFDTDAHGRSTVGRGGGTSREEAGAVTDWRKQRDRKPPKGSPLKGEEGVRSFLEAVNRIDGPNLDESGRDVRGTPEEQQARASALMAEYKGDARLMTLAWFGRTVETDTSLWSDSDRWYVNAVAVRVGYNKVPPQGIGTIIPGTQAAPDLGPGNATPGNEASRRLITDPRTGEQTWVGGHTESPDAGDALPTADAIANRVLGELGWPQTPDMERAVIAWIRTESPKDTVSGNNPFGIMTPGPHDLPGQVGVDENGRAIFDSMEAGIRAATSDIEANYPDVVAAGNTGNAEKVYDALGSSGYNGGNDYRRQLIATYNQTPGTGTMVGGAMLDVPANMGDLAGRNRDIADLFRVDPFDPEQVDWYERNMDNAAAAMDSGSAKWRFETLDGRFVELDFTPEMAAQLVATRGDYYEQVGEQGLANATKRRAQNMMGDIAVDFIADRIEGLNREQEQALRNGDIATAANIALERDAAIHALLGVPIDEPIDVDAIRANPPPGLNTDDLDRISGWVDENENDAILNAVDREIIYVEKDATGTITAAQPDPNRFYVKLGTDGVPEARIEGFREEQGEFALVPVTVINPDGSESIVMKPAYQDRLIRAVGTGVAGEVYVEPISSSIPAGALDYAGYRQPVPGFIGPEPTVITALPPGPTSGIGQGTILGSGVDAVDSIFDFIGGAARTVAGASGLPVGPEPQQTQEMPPAGGGRIGRQVRSPQDALVLQGGATIPVTQVEIADPDTGERQVWFTVDGVTWAGGDKDVLTDRPPMWVLNQESGISIVRTADQTYLARNGQPIPQGEMTQEFYRDNFHVFGTRPEDNPNPYTPPYAGAPGQFMKVIKGAPSAAGGLTLDVTAPDVNPEVQQWREMQKLPHIFGQFAAQRSGVARVREDAARRIEDAMPGSLTGINPTARTINPVNIRPSTAGSSFVVPNVKAGPNIMTALGRWRTGTASAAIANGTAREQANARAVIAAAERERILARNRAAAAQVRRTTAAAPKPTSTPPPVGGSAPPLPPRTPKPSTAPKPKPPTGQQAGAIIGGGGSALKPQAPVTPKPPAPGPRRV